MNQIREFSVSADRRLNSDWSLLFKQRFPQITRNIFYILIITYIIILQAGFLPLFEDMPASYYLNHTYQKQLVHFEIYVMKFKSHETFFRWSVSENFYPTILI